MLLEGTYIDLAIWLNIDFIQMGTYQSRLEKVMILVMRKINLEMSLLSHGRTGLADVLRQLGWSMATRQTPLPPDAQRRTSGTNRSQKYWKGNWKLKTLLESVPLSPSFSASNLLCSSNSREPVRRLVPLQCVYDRRRLDLLLQQIRLEGLKIIASVSISTL